jgi:hypothetical protein
MYYGHVFYIKRETVSYRRMDWSSAQFCSKNCIIFCDNADYFFLAKTFFSTTSCCFSFSALGAKRVQYTLVFLLATGI